VRRDILRTSSTPYGNFTSLAVVAAYRIAVAGVAGVSWAKSLRQGCSAVAKEAISVVLESPFFIAEAGQWFRSAYHNRSDAMARQALSGRKSQFLNSSINCDANSARNIQIMLHCQLPGCCPTGHFRETLRVRPQHIVDAFSLHSPSPTAAAQRFTEPERTSPAAKIPGQLVFQMAGRPVHSFPFLQNRQPHCPF